MKDEGGEIFSLCIKTLSSRGNQKLIDVLAHREFSEFRDKRMKNIALHSTFIKLTRKQCTRVLFLFLVILLKLLIFSDRLLIPQLKV